ncbi:PHP domain-containing protein [Fibrobacterales bacterium]|nr:PHP domain-containing protein [Fibrobacterales bacterium]
MPLSFSKKNKSTTTTPVFKKYVDLHMHTVYSDGSLTPCELVDLAVSKKLSCIAITDHDNFDAYGNVAKYAEENDIELIPAIEISAFHEGRDIHILGYFIDTTHLQLNQEMQKQAVRRVQRIKQILKKLGTLGIEIPFEAVQKKAGSGVIGRPHIAKIMIEEEYVSNFHEAFSKYLGNEGEAFIDKKGLSTTETIKLIRKAGGVAVLAHPYRTQCDELIPEMVEAGLAGLETFCANQRSKVGKKYRSLAKQHDLVCTGGTDFHSPEQSATLGSLKIPYEVMDNLRLKQEAQRAEWF